MPSQFKVVVVFEQFHHLTVLRGSKATSLLGLFSQEGFLLGRIVALVSRLVEMSLPATASSFLNHFPMPVLGRAHEIVMTKAQLIYKDLPAGSQIIAVILRVQTLFGRCLLDLLSVFIQARQKNVDSPKLWCTLAMASVTAFS